MVDEEKISNILDPPNIDKEEKAYLTLKKDPTESTKRKITEKLKSVKDNGKLSYQQYMELLSRSQKHYWGYRVSPRYIRTQVILHTDLLWIIQGVAPTR